MDEAELERARRVHYAFLPERYEDETLEVAVRAVPHGGIGGDYCGIEPLTEGRIALTVSDATGHDIASALFAARINTYVVAVAAACIPAIFRAHMDSDADPRTPDYAWKRTRPPETCS